MQAADWERAVRLIVKSMTLAGDGDEYLVLRAIILAALSWVSHGGEFRPPDALLGVEDVAVPQGGGPPAGARGSGAAEVGALLVTLGQSPEVLSSVISVIRAWLSRAGRSRRSVRLVLGDDTLELSQASATEQDRLIDLFISRHPAEGKAG